MCFYRGLTQSNLLTSPSFLQEPVRKARQHINFYICVVMLCGFLFGSVVYFIMPSIDTLTR